MYGLLALVSTVALAAGVSLDTALTQIADSEPVAVAGETLTLGGTRIRFNGCAAFDVYEGLGAPTEVVLRWTEPSGRRDWLQGVFDHRLRSYQGRLFQGWLELGGGLEAVATGMLIRARSADVQMDCEGEVLPVYEVEEVVSGYDPRRPGPVDPSIAPIAAPFPEQSPTVQELHGAVQGRSDDLAIEVDGITDPSLGWPPWMLLGVSGVDESVSSFGFVELQYADPALEPDPDVELARLLAERGLTEVGQLRRGQRSELRRLARRRALGSRYTYRGRFTGEVTLFRDSEAIYLTPVFLVTAVEDPSSTRTP